MARGSHSNGVFVVGGIAEIGTSSTVTDGDGFTSLVVPVWDVKKLMLQAELTGEADGTGDVDFVVVGRIKDGGNWDTVAAFTLTAAQNGASAVYESLQIDVQGYHSIKLLSVENKDEAKKATLVNLNWGKSYGAKDW